MDENIIDNNLFTEEERKKLWEQKMSRTFKSEYNEISSTSKESWNEYFDAVMKADSIPKYKK